MCQRASERDSGPARGAGGSTSDDVEEKLDPNMPWGERRPSLSCEKLREKLESVEEKLDAKPAGASRNENEGIVADRPRAVLSNRGCADMTALEGIRW